MSRNNLSTGYGPRPRIIFDGDERYYELWEVKFLGFLKIRGLDEVTKNLDVQDPEEIDQNKNSEVYAELVQVLDDRSLSLIIRDAPNDGRAALRILRQHYLPKGKPRVITLYTELTSLSKSNTESVTDYIIRAETAAASLKAAGEPISDSLLVAMTLKGLPKQFKAFTTVVTQKDNPMSFTEFKVALRNFEDTEKIQTPSASNIMTVTTPHYYQNPSSRTKYKSTPTTNKWCRNCKMSNHDTEYCRRAASNSNHQYFKKDSRWCEICRNSTHDTKHCRKLSKIRQVTSDEQDEENSHFIFVLDNVNLTSNSSENAFIVDSGATVHVVNDKSKFIKFHPNFNPANHVIELADGQRHNNLAMAQGDAKITLTDTNRLQHDVLLKNALYVPSFSQNIFSVLAATKNGADIRFGSKSELHSNGTCFDIHKDGKLYFLKSSIVSSKSSSHTLQEWHTILGHSNKKDLLKLENSVDGMVISDKNNFDCEICTLGKMTETRSRKPDCTARRPLDVVHIDLAGPVEPCDIHGMKYSLVCVDHYTNLTFTYFMKQKCDTPKAFRKFLCDISPYGKVKTIRSDQGGEFISDEFSSLLSQNKIKHEKTAPYSPHQNGKAERTWRSLFEMARCLLLQSGLPKTLWTYAILTAAYVRNRCFNKNIERTPFEGMTGKRPNIAEMEVFGTTCYALTHNPRKLDDRSEKGKFIGYDRSSPSYLVYFPETQTVKKVRCVKFLRQNCLPLENFDYALLPSDKKFGDDDSKSQTKQTNDSPHKQADQGILEANKNNEQGTEYDNEKNGKRIRTRPKYLDDYIVENNVDDLMNVTVHYCYRLGTIPKTYHEAMSGENANMWHKAMDDEIRALDENDTFELTSLPPDRKAIGGKWVYSIKSGPSGEDKYKARFVAKGYSQIADIDYFETFSPTARITSIRALIQYAVQNDFIIHQMDVKSAFLNADIDCELYVEQPEGYQIKSKSGKALVLKLKKSLYGLKQSGRNWNVKLHNFLTEQGFTQSMVDPCVYISYQNDHHSIILVWVDDLILAANNESRIDDMKANLSAKFSMKDLGKIAWFLGIEFTHSNNSIQLSQTHYINKLLEKFGMTNSKPKYTPCDVNFNKFCEEPAELIDDKPYREIVGSLIYVITATRPDLCFVVTKLSQYLSKPTANHLTAAKHVLRYLKATLNQKLVYCKSEEPLKLTGFCDADWGNSGDRRSITGYCFMLSGESLISWKSRKQPTVSLSTCEAEYMSMCAATQEGLFLRALIRDMMGMELSSFSLNCDNQGAIALGSNPVQQQRSKHIDIKFHFIRNEIKRGAVHMLYVPSDQNLADIFTKPVSKAKLKMFMPIVMGEYNSH